MILLIILNSILAIIKKIVQVPIEPEFKTFGIVLLSKAYGVSFGFFFVVASSLIQIAIMQRFNFQMIIELFTLILLVYISRILSIDNIIAIGIIVSIINMIFIFVFLQFVFFVPPSVIVIACFSNIFFNIIIFSTFGNLFYGLMT